MKKTFGWAILSLLVLIPLTLGCSTTDAGTALPTVVPTSVMGGAEATATALPTNVSGAATAATTAVSGAATAVTTAVSGSLSAEDRAYLQKVYTIATATANAPELSNVVQSLNTAASTGASGGTVDTAAVNDALSKAATFLNGQLTQAQALTPPADMQSVQTQLIKGLTDWQSAVLSAQTAVGAQNWADATTAATQMAQGASDMAGLLADLAARGIQ